MEAQEKQTKLFRTLTANRRDDGYCGSPPPEARKLKRSSSGFFPLPEENQGICPPPRANSAITVPPEFPNQEPGRLGPDPADDIEEDFGSDDEPFCPYHVAVYTHIIQKKLEETEQKLRDTERKLRQATNLSHWQREFELKPLREEAKKASNLIENLQRLVAEREPYPLQVAALERANQNLQQEIVAPTPLTETQKKEIHNIKPMLLFFVLLSYNPNNKQASFSERVARLAPFYRHLSIRLILETATKAWIGMIFELIKKIQKTIPAALSAGQCIDPYTMLLNRNIAVYFFITMISHLTLWLLDDTESQQEYEHKKDLYLLLKTSNHNRKPHAGENSAYHTALNSVEADAQKMIEQGQTHFSNIMKVFLNFAAYGFMLGPSVFIVSLTASLFSAFLINTTLTYLSKRNAKKITETDKVLRSMQTSQKKSLEGRREKWLSSIFTALFTIVSLLIVKRYLLIGTMDIVYLTALSTTAMKAYDDFLKPCLNLRKMSSFSKKLYTFTEGIVEGTPNFLQETLTNDVCKEPFTSSTGNMKKAIMYTTLIINTFGLIYLPETTFIQKAYNTLSSFVLSASTASLVKYLFIGLILATTASYLYRTLMGENTTTEKIGHRPFFYFLLSLSLALSMYHIYHLFTQPLTVSLFSAVIFLSTSLVTTRVFDKAFLKSIALQLRILFNHVAQATDIAAKTPASLLDATISATCYTSSRTFNKASSTIAQTAQYIGAGCRSVLTF